jgi:endonuclease-3
MMAKTTRSRSSTRRRIGLEPMPDAVVSSSSNAASSSSPAEAVSSNTGTEPHPSPVKSTSKVALSSKRKRSLPSRVKSSSLSNEKQKRPTAEECKFVVKVLGEIHPDVVEENNKRREAFIERKKNKKQKPNKQNWTPVTDAVISTMLSQNTTAANQNRAFAGLKETFPGGWEEVATADTSAIEDAIRVAGLAKIRAERMQSMLQTVKQERGEANFEYLQHFASTDAIQKELSRFKGMGPKTISCVCLFALGIPEFPVDTHVLRISQKLGWVSASTSREAAYEYLNECVPEEHKLDLHCLLVTHGKWCYNCAANGKPQFKPKEKWTCPLIGMKSGKIDIKPKVEKQVKVKKEEVKH